MAEGYKNFLLHVDAYGESDLNAPKQAVARIGPGFLPFCQQAREAFFLAETAGQTVGDIRFHNKACRFSQGLQSARLRTPGNNLADDEVIELDFEPSDREYIRAAVECLMLRVTVNGVYWYAFYEDTDVRLVTATIKWDHLGLPKELPPLHKHTCQRCTFLKRHAYATGDHAPAMDDLYICDTASLHGPLLVVRHSSDPDDYTSITAGALKQSKEANPSLLAALERAQIRGMIE